MTIMIESSRSFLFTEYARTGCGTFKDQGTDPKVWDALPVSSNFLPVYFFEGLVLTLFVGQILGISEYSKDPAACQGGQGGSQAATGDFL